MLFMKDLICIQTFIYILIVHFQQGFPISGIFGNYIYMVFITIPRNNQVILDIKTQCKLDSPVIEYGQSIKHIIVINIPEILPGTPGHLIWRIQIHKVIKSDSFHHHPVITSLENHIVFIEDFTPLIKYFLQSFGFYTIPCDMKGVVEITIFIISRNSIGASPHQEEVIYSR